MAQDEAQYSKPASQVDLEARLENENRSSRIVTTSSQYVAPEDEGGRDFRVEGNDTDGYIGTSPEYMTYANETEAPLVAEDSAEEEVAQAFLDGMEPLDQSKSSDKESSDADEGVPGSDSTPSSTPSTSQSQSSSTSPSGSPSES